LRHTTPHVFMSAPVPVPNPIPAGMTAKQLAETVSRVAQASQRAARPTPARLVAVSKTKPVAQLMEVLSISHSLNTLRLPVYCPVWRT
jgi:hypothetical protein